MMEKYEFDLGGVKLNIDLFKTKTFCRYCKKLNAKCLTKHRSAVAWFIRASTANKNVYYIVTDGEIPPELATESDGIVEHYTTGGGWEVPRAIVHLSEDEFYEYVERIDDEPTNYELQCLIHRLLGKHKHIEAPVSVPRVLLLTILADLNVKPEDITKIELSWLKNLYKKWLDDSTKYIDNIAIIRIPKSYREVIRFAVFGIELENKKYNTVIENYNALNARVFEIYEKCIYSRNLIAVYVDYSVFKKVLFYKKDGEWHGMEKYFKHTHPECVLHHVCIEKLLHEMVHKRLGDLLFLDHLDVEKFRGRITPATKEQLNKVSFVNATMEEVERDNRKILKIKPENEDTPIVVTHPEHGSIELSPTQVYYIFRVPYIQPGHD